MTLSLCMITRNEGHQISRCLSSIKDYVDEIVLVDTGSSDQTVALAHRWGARVAHCAWDDDFSKARNQSLELAQGDWIFFMDGDEELAPGSGEILLKTIRQAEYEAFWVQVINTTGTNSRLKLPAIRLFRNRNNYRFQGRIHEQIITSIIEHSQPESIGSSGIEILHHGYNSNEADIAAKTRRNLKILQSYPEEHKNGFYYYNLGSEYLRAGQREKALACFEYSVRQTPPRQGFAPILVKKTIIALMELRKYMEAVRQLSYYQTIYPDFNDLLMLEAICYLNMGRFSQAARILKKYQALPASPSWYPSEENLFGLSAEALLQQVERECLEADHPVLSVCLYGKDEAEVLPATIKSVNELGNELLYLDMESTDASGEIAEQFGARVFSGPWPDNRTRLYQQVLDHAGGEWILLLKADESLSRESCQQLISALKAENQAYLLPIFTPLTDSEAESEVRGEVRLFRRASLASDLTAKPFPVLNTPIKHRHFLISAAYSTNKQQQNWQKAIELSRRDPAGSWYARGRVHFYAHDYTQAVEAMQKALLLGAANLPPTFYYHYALALMGLSRYDSVIRLLEPAQELYSDYLDLHYLLALAQYAAGNETEAEKLLLYCIEISVEPWGKYVCASGTGTYQAMASLAAIYAARQQPDRALDYLTRAALYPGAFSLVIGQILLLKDKAFFSLEKWMQQSQLWNVHNLFTIALNYAQMNRYHQCWHYLQTAVQAGGKKKENLPLLLEGSEKLLRIFAGQLASKIAPTSCLLKLCREEKLI